jgi:hypothetical protein
VPADCFYFRQIEPENLVGGDMTKFGVVIRNVLRFRDPGVVNDDDLIASIGCTAEWGAKDASQQQE